MAVKSKAKSKPVAKAKSKAKPAVKTKGSVYTSVQQDIEKGREFASDFWQPRESRQHVRLIPFTDPDGNERLFVKQSKHWGIEEDGKNRPVTCGGEDCPICEMKGEVPDDVWARIRKQTQYLCNVIVRGGKGEEDKQVLAQVSASVAQQFQEYIDPEHERHVKDCLDSGSKGRDFRILREKNKKSGFIEYTVDACMETCSLGLEVDPKDLTIFAAEPDEAALASAVRQIKAGKVKGQKE